MSERIFAWFLLPVFFFVLFGLPFIFSFFVIDSLFGDFLERHQSKVQMLTTLVAVWFLIKIYHDDLVNRLDGIDRRLMVLEEQRHA